MTNIEPSACGRYLIVRTGAGAAHVLGYEEGDRCLEQALGVYNRAAMTDAVGLVALARSLVDAWRIALNEAQQRRVK